MRRREPLIGQVPAGSVVYAVGDIHGRSDLLERLHRNIDRDAHERGGDVVIVYLGDYIDRGPDSRGVIDGLLDAPAGDTERIFLRGNHEQALLDFVDGDLEMGAAWIGFGGGATLASYGVSGRFDPEDLASMEDLKHQILNQVPEPHWTFLRASRSYYLHGNYAFVHAGIRPGKAIEDQRGEDLLWIRDEFLDSSRIHDRIVVHGHSVVDQVEFHDNRIAMDTAAFATGMLSCLVLENDSRSVLQT